MRVVRVAVTIAQATVYDIGCLVLKSAPDISSISISTPNVHYIPFHSLGVRSPAHLIQG